MKILIAEDDLLARRLLHHILRPYGPVDIAIDGQEAIDSYEMSWDQGAPYDLLFLDIMMPKKDGHMVLDHVREREPKWRSSDVPTGPGELRIVITTALGDSKTVISSFSEGADFFLVKPLFTDKVEGLLKELGAKKLQYSD